METISSSLQDIDIKCYTISFAHIIPYLTMNRSQVLHTKKRGTPCKNSEQLSDRRNS